MKKLKNSILIFALFAFIPNISNGYTCSCSVQSDVAGFVTISYNSSGNCCDQVGEALVEFYDESGDFEWSGGAPEASQIGADCSGSYDC